MQVLCRLVNIRDKLVCSLICKHSHQALAFSQSWKVTSICDRRMYAHKSGMSFTLAQSLVTKLPMKCRSAHLEASFGHIVKLHSAHVAAWLICFMWQMRMALLVVCAGLKHVRQIIKDNGSHIETLIGTSKSPAEFIRWAKIWQSLPKLKTIEWNAPLELLSSASCYNGPILPSPPADCIKLTFGFMTEPKTYILGLGSLIPFHLSRLGVTACVTNLAISCLRGDTGTVADYHMDLSGLFLPKCIELDITAWHITGVLDAPALKKLSSTASSPCQQQ